MQKTLKPADKLARIVEDFSKVTITVLGDLVADEFIYGEIARVSREAPVLILRHRDRTVVPGGAGNAIYNLADLGVNVLPVGVIGDDEPGRLLLRAFRQKRVSVSGIRRVKGRNTVTKTRILAGTTHSPRQQVVRVDHEPESPLDHAATQELIFQTRGYVRASDRKSTRLNSSHQIISYAVFCFKKKTFYSATPPTHPTNPPPHHPTQPRAHTL